MKNLLFIILLFTSNYIFAQSTTITPGAVLPQMTTAQRTGLANPVNGMMVYDLGTSSYWYYQNTAWAELPKAGSTSNYWELNGANGNEIKNTNSGGFWSANPTTVASLSGVVNTVPVEGDGTRLMWIPSMSAFRVGTAAFGSKAWDKDSVGAFSMGIGFNTKAKGIASIAMGAGTTASDYSSTAMGEFTTASGSYSTAMGRSTTASGDYSTGMGTATTASGDYSTAIGESTTASGLSSTAMGSETTASGDNSTAMGYNTDASGIISTAMGSSTTASGNFSTAMGNSTTASGFNSTAMGNSTTASGNNSTAMGIETNAKAFGGTSIGNYSNNTDSPSPTIPSSIDRIFQIGNGSSPSTRSNAMTVLRNAKTGINTANPQALLHLKGGDGTVNGHIRLERSANSEYASIFTDFSGLNFRNSTATKNFSFQNNLGVTKTQIDNDGNVDIDGFTQLGNNAPKIKTKKITGTTSTNSTGTTGLSVSFSHGIGNADKILSIDVMVENASGQWTHGWYPQPNYEFGYYLTNSSVVIVNTAGNSSVIADRPVRVLIVYEE